MEVYTPFDELIIFGFMFIWLSFSGAIVIIVDNLLWKRKERKHDKSSDIRRGSKLHEDSGCLHCDNCRDMADRADSIPDGSEVAK